MNFLIEKVEEGIEDELKSDVLEKIKEMIPNVEVITFEIPQLRNKNKKNHEFITFHEEIGMIRLENKTETEEK